MARLSSCNRSLFTNRHLTAINERRWRHKFSLKYTLKVVTADIHRIFFSHKISFFFLAFYSSCPLTFFYFGLKYSVTTKVTQGAKNFGSFLYSAVNKASSKIKETVKDNVSSVPFIHSFFLLPFVRDKLPFEQ